MVSEVELQMPFGQLIMFVGYYSRNVNEFGYLMLFCSFLVGQA